MAGAGAAAAAGPSPAPSSVMERTASTTISTMSSTIIFLVMRSTPFFSPSEQMPKPSRMTIARHSTCTQGSATSPSNCALTPSAVIPAKSPRIILKIYARIQPEITV